MPARHHPSQWVGDESIAFLETQARDEPDRPWMLFSSYIHPHPPFAPPARWHKLYRGIAVRRPFLPPFSEKLLTRLPGRFAPATVCDQPVSLIDVMPTILNAAGLDVPSGCEGVDLADVAAGRCDRQAVFTQHQRGETATYMVVTDQWKYVYSAPDRREFLFDRRVDRPESRDRAGLNHFSADQTAMRSLLIDFLRDTGHTEGLDGEGFKLFDQPSIPENPDGGLLLQDNVWADESIPGYTD